MQQSDYLDSSDSLPSILYSNPLAHSTPLRGFTDDELQQINANSKDAFHANDPEGVSLSESESPLASVGSETAPQSRNK
ncbi:unnamed protein product, partial [Allacma fusca]